MPPVLMMSSRRPSTKSFPVLDAPVVVGAEPARAIGIRAEGGLGQGRVVRIPLCERLAAELDDAHAVRVGVGDPHPRDRQGATVVDTATGSLAHAVCGDDPCSGLGGGVAKSRRDGGSADEDRRQARERRSPPVVREETSDLGRDERGIPPVMREPGRCGGEPSRCEPAGIERDRLDADDGRAHEHLDARDVRRRGGEEPLARPAEDLESAACAGGQGPGREAGSLRHACGAGGADEHHRLTRVDG